VDDSEGFRVLVIDKDFFVYGVYADPVFYRRATCLYDAHFGDSPVQRGDSRGLMFEVHDSELVAVLRQTTDIGHTVDVAVRHYALCFWTEERIDIVSRSPVSVRAAGDRAPDGRLR
jgi:hypothetical protein